MCLRMESVNLIKQTDDSSTPDTWSSRFESARRTPSKQPNVVIRLRANGATSLRAIENDKSNSSSCSSARVESPARNCCLSRSRWLVGTSPKMDFRSFIRDFFARGSEHNEGGPMSPKLETFHELCVFCFFGLTEVAPSWSPI